MSVAPAQDSSSFLKEINDSNFGQLVGLASNIAGSVQGALAVLDLLGINPLGPSGTDQILSAIAALQQQLDQDFQMLGDLIRAQTKTIVDTTNRDTMLLALARSSTGLDRIQEFLATNDRPSLEDAETESDGGAQFFNGLPPDAPDLPFFLPGMVKAGTIRIFVIASEPPSFRSPEVVTADLNEMIATLGNILNAIEQSVNNAHFIKEVSHTIQSHPGGGGHPLPNEEIVIIDGFQHRETTDDQGDSAVVNFFPCDRDPASPFLPTSQAAVSRAESLAEQDRDNGVAEELAALGFPMYELILQQWKSTIIQ
jgi:hypothetical protein